MSDEFENLTLAFLRRLDAKMDRLSEDVADLKGCVGTVETGLHSVRRGLVGLAGSDARLQVAMDAQAQRLERIERRLDLANA